MYDKKFIDLGNLNETVNSITKPTRLDEAMKPINGEVHKHLTGSGWTHSREQKKPEYGGPKYNIDHYHHPSKGKVEISNAPAPFVKGHIFHTPHGQEPDKARTKLSMDGLKKL